MPQIIVAIDCVGSSLEKDTYGEKQANQRITAALTQARQSMQDADPNLHRAASAAGDSILMIGGTDVSAIYKAAVVHQAIFRAMHYSRIPLKISIGYGELQPVEDGGFTDYRSWELDMIYRINEICPPGGVNLTASFELLLRETRFGERLIEMRKDLKGFGIRTFYESNGDYQIPENLQQRAHRRKTDVERPRRKMPEWAWAALVVIVYSAMFTVIVLHLKGAR